MPSYSCKDIKDKTWKAFLWKTNLVTSIVNIKTTQYPLLMFSLD